MIHVKFWRSLASAMSHGETPKNLCAAKKPRHENLNDYCRCCKLSLKLQYGDSWKSLSTENLFKPSNKKGIEGEILSQVLEQAGIEVIRNSNLSERLCKPCAAKLRRTCEGMTFISRTINVVNPKFVAVDTCIELEVESTECHPPARRFAPNLLCSTQPGACSQANSLPPQTLLGLVTRSFPTNVGEERVTSLKSVCVGG